MQELIKIKLVRSGNQRQGEALLTSLQHWKAYAESASAIRLQVLQFAVSDHDEVLITGSPLPSLPGKEFWIENDILLPCGFEFEIASVAGFIREKINTGGDNYIVFDQGGQWQKISKTFFVPAKRSAIRLTKKISNHLFA